MQAPHLSLLREHWNKYVAWWDRHSCSVEVLEFEAQLSELHQDLVVLLVVAVAAVQNFPEEVDEIQILIQHLLLYPIKRYSIDYQLCKIYNPTVAAARAA